MAEQRSESTKVKVCGVTRLHDAELAASLGAWAVGMIFYEPSPRRCSLEQAQTISQALRRNVQLAGVFVNESLSQIARIAEELQLSIVQLHGDETAEVVSRMRRSIRVIKAIRVRESFHVAELANFKGASSILLDGFDAQLRGGTGKSFNWKLAKSAGRKRQIFLAGGLTPENAAEAVSAARPFAIDVCSGVETRPGKKDVARMRALVAAVRPLAERRAASKTRGVSPTRRKRRS